MKQKGPEGNGSPSKKKSSRGSDILYTRPLNRRIGKSRVQKPKKGRGEEVKVTS